MQIALPTWGQAFSLQPGFCPAPSFFRRLSRICLLLFLLNAAHAAPISNCITNLSGIGITCNIYESDASGNPSEISSIFSLGTTAVAGYVVLLESPLADQTNTAMWSDVLHFIDNGAGLATTAQLLSDGCGCFPTFATVNAAGAQFIVETQFGTGDDFTDFTPYQPTATDTYNIYSAAPFSAVPEPGSLPLVGGAIVIIAAVLVVRKRQSRPLRYDKS